MKIDMIGCLHGDQPFLQGGDLLIVTGDLTANDKPIQYSIFLAWLDRQKYKKKIVIGGNHDALYEKKGFENIKDIYLDLGIDYLCDSGTEFEGFKIWGSPWSNHFQGLNPHCAAFTGKESELAKKFELIPDDVDILITHAPPYMILDESVRGDLCGSQALRYELDTRIKPKIHVFSHIHERYGQLIYKRPGFGDENNTLCINCSIMDEDYEPINKPIRIEL